MTEQAAQKTGGARRVRRLLLLLQLLQLRLSLLQGILLHQHCLRQNIERIRIASQALIQ
jgi:hypothetical protein